MRGVRRILVGLAVALSLPCAGLARGAGHAPASAATGITDSLAIPGGARAIARVIGLDAARPRGVVLLDVIRVIYEVDEGVDKKLDRRRAALRGYLEAIAAFERARLLLPGGSLALKLAEQPATRSSVETFARSLGTSLDESGRTYRLVASDSERDTARRRWLKEAGLDLDSLVRDVNAGNSVKPALPSDEVPLPAAAAAWLAAADPPSEFAGCLAAVLLGDRRLSLAYYGLSSLDADTRAFLTSEPNRFKRLITRLRASVLASRGRSLRIRDGLVEVPGGPEAAPMWEGMVGARVTDPFSFVLSLLERDDGRLALFYDTVGHLAPPAQRYVLGAGIPDIWARLHKLRELYGAFQAALVGWEPEARPFLRVVDDAAYVLMVTRMGPDGGVAPPAGRRFWQFVFDSPEVFSRTTPPVRGLERDQPMDALALIDLMCVVNTSIRLQRVEAWQFAQRVFGAAPPGAMMDVAVAVRGLARFRLLVLTLERMGIRDPAVYAAAVRNAQRLAGIADPGRIAVSLAQFQGALAVIERARFGRVITIDTASRLVTELSELELTPDDEYLGALGAWLDDRLLPAFDIAPGPPPSFRDPPGPAEYRAIGAMAGLGRTDAAAPMVQWEGLRYRIDPGAAELERLVKIRRKQGGPSLDAVLAFVREVNALRTSVTRPAELPARVAAIRTAFAGAGRAAPSVQAEAPRVAMATLGEWVSDALNDIQKHAGARDLARLERDALPLRRAADHLVAAELTSLAYAPHLGDPDGSALLAGDPALRHDFGETERNADLRLMVAWREPVERIGGAGGWRASGSLLGLDIGLSRLWLRRVANDSLSVPPTVSDSDRAAVTASAVLLNIFDMTDEGQAEVADAVRRGRARADALRADRRGLAEIVRQAGFGEWRREALPWSLDHEPDRAADYFSMADLYRIGAAESPSAALPDGWGASRYSFEGCLCVRFPTAEPWENYTGMKGRVLVVSQVNDSVLRVAEVLAELGLPARLSRAMMAYATQDVLDGMRPPTIDDWATIVASARRIPRARMEDYVAALTTGGPLMPAEGDVRQ
jgi:hypothetical protein